MEVGLIWAQSPTGVIGRDGTLPWHVPEDLAHFRKTTSGRPVVMGRATWQSLPPAFRPLPGRRNVVLSRAGFAADGALVVDSLEAALHALAGEQGAPDEVWVIGGGAVYAAALPLADRVEVTVVDVAGDGDTHAPHLHPDEWRLVSADPAGGWHTSSTGLRYRFQSYRRA